MPATLTCVPALILNTSIDVGHQALAELLAGVVRMAAQSVAAAAAAGSRDSSSSDGGDGDSASSGNVPAELPPPMIPGNVDSPTSLCAMQVS